MAEIGAERAIADEGNQFAIWFGEEILGFELGLVAEKLHIGASGDHKIDLGIAEDDVPIRIIAQCKFSKGGKGNYNLDLVDEVLNAKKRAIQSPLLGNTRRQEFCVRYNAASQKPERLLAIGFGTFAKDAFDYAVDSGVVIYDHERLYREWISRNDPAGLPPPKMISIPASTDVRIEKGKKPRRTFITTISTKTLYEIVKEHGLGLFSENFRYKLPSSARSDAIADATRATLEKESSKLLERNNGLTFIGEKIEPGSTDLKIITPQIVNGCQTSYAIHEWYDQRVKGGQDIKDLLEGEVMVKIVEADNVDAGKIAEAANRQNPISSRDLHANQDSQSELVVHFKEFNPKIFFETREGAWAAVEARKETGLYQIPGGGRRYRTVNNEVAGQIFLAVLGFPHWSKDRKKSIWEDEAINKAIFGFHDDASVRFTGSIRNDTPTPDVLTSIPTGSKAFIQDSLFGYAVLQYLDALRLKIYPEKLGLWADPAADPIGRIVQSKAFLDYWEFHVCALINFVIVKMTGGNRDKIEKARELLIGSDYNIVFSTPGKRAQKFETQKDSSLHDLLDYDSNKDEPFNRLSQWFNSLDTIFSDLIDTATKTGDFKNLNHFFYKRDSTYKDAIEKASKWFGSKTDRKSRFPLPDL